LPLNALLDACHPCLPSLRVEAWLSQHGHVSALQEDNVGDAMYTQSKGMVEQMVGGVAVVMRGNGWACGGARLVRG